MHTMNSQSFNKSEVEQLCVLTGLLQYISITLIYIELVLYYY